LHTLVFLHALAIALPYAWAAGLVPDGAVWGGLLFSPDDQNVHLAWARQAAQGQLFVRDVFTTENLSDGSRPLFFNALTFLIGSLSRLTTLDVVWIYHAVRVASAVLGLYALHALSKRWSGDWRVRLSTVALAAFAGGAGWLASLLPQVLGSRVLIDRPDGSLMMPEAWGFASNFAFALNAASILLLCVIYERLGRAREGDKKALSVAAMAALLLSNIHTYDAIPLVVIIAIAAFLEARGAGKEKARGIWKPSLIVIAAALLPIAWQVLVYANSAEFRLKAQTPTPAPPIWDLLLSYSPLFILAVVGLISMRRGGGQVLGEGKYLPVAWAVATVVLIYAPVSFARKMIEGLHLPLCFLAALGLTALLSKLKNPVRRVAWVGAVFVLSLSMVKFALWCVGENWADNNRSRGLMPPLYIAQSDARALAFIDEQPTRAKYLRAALCLPKVGSYVPRATGASTFAGHWAETLNLEGRNGKLAQAIRFYEGGLSTSEAGDWLAKNHIRWVLEGPYEKAAGSNIAARYPNLKQVWAQGETRLFRFDG
jgi:hypothetical protein